MMSLSPIGLGSMKPALPSTTISNKQVLNPTVKNEPETESSASTTNASGLSTDDLALLSQLLASSEEGAKASSEPASSKRSSPSGAMLEAQLPNISRNDICKQDGLCSACTVEEES